MRKDTIDNDLDFLWEIVSAPLKHRQRLGLAARPRDVQMALKVIHLRHERQVAAQLRPEILRNPDSKNPAPLSGEPELVAELRQADVVDRVLGLGAVESFERLLEALDLLSPEEREHALTELIAEADNENK